MATTKWRYYVRTGNLSQDALDEIGRDGWELISVIAPASQPIFYFKRPHPSFKEMITLDQRQRYFAEGDVDRDSDG